MRLAYLVIQLAYQSSVACLFPIMPPRVAGKGRLPQRSQGAPVRLARRTCLRYSKRITLEPDHRYGYKDYRKYSAYSRKYKEYKPVYSPPGYHRSNIANPYRSRGSLPRL